jgi:hypothetical protein
MSLLDDLPFSVIQHALEREKEVLEEALSDELDPHEEFDKSVLLAVIEDKIRMLKISIRFAQT